MASPPGQRLVPPQPVDPLPDVLTNSVGFTQYISLTYWMSVILDECFGFDPVQWLADELTGDWRAVQAAGQALKNLALFNDDMSASLTERSANTGTTWQGNAATDAGRYLADLAEAIRQQRDALDSAGQQFEDIALGMNRWTAAARGLLLTFGDLLIAAGLSAAATAALGVTGVGAILGAAATAATITKMMGVWGQIVTLHGFVVTSVNGLLGLAAGYGSSLRDIDQRALAATPYDNPTVS